MENKHNPGLSINATLWMSISMSTIGGNNSFTSPAWPLVAQQTKEGYVTQVIPEFWLVVLRSGLTSKFESHNINTEMTYKR